MFHVHEFRSLWKHVFLSMVVACVAFAEPSQTQSLVSAGNLPGMRWPNFRDYQPWLQEFYEPSGYAPAWMQANAASPQALAMITILRDAWQKGLEPEDYDASRWNSRLPALQGSPQNQATFDVSLTVCAMRYISDLRIGRINPQHFKFGLTIEHKKYDLAQFLRDRVLPASDLRAVLDSLEPPFGGYRRTEQALVKYVQFARDNKDDKLPVPAKVIDPGQPYSGVAQLIRRLQLVGDLPAGAQVGHTQIYDATLADTVKRFQRRHGLDDDGRLGPSTVKQLNVPLADRVRQLQLTLERWRWLPIEFSNPPIVVNIPDFRLRALDENNGVAFDMRVVVGKAMTTETPVFSRDMKFVVFRPYWNIPPGIFRRSTLPAIKRNRNYVKANNFEVTNNDGSAVTSGEISDDVLAQLQSGQLSVRQKPGPNNALGLVKLMFPNEHHVYLHSTPATELFSRSRRDFSAGCIRVERPSDLTAWVLRFNSGWPLERVRDAMQAGKDNVTVNLVRPIPVFIVYGTAIAYENGEVHFYDDIYAHDARLAKALAKGRPYPNN